MNDTAIEQQLQANKSLRMEFLTMALRMPWVNCTKEAVKAAAEFHAYIDGAAAPTGAEAGPRQAGCDNFCNATTAISDNLSAAITASAAAVAVLGGMANASGEVPLNLLRADKQSPVGSAHTSRRAERLSDAEFVNAIKADAGKSGAASAPGQNHGGASDTDFGFALKCLKAGKRVARTGWNGEGMFVYLVPAASYPVQTGAAKSHFGESSMVPYNAYLALKGVDDTVSTWAPSGSDALADDWQLVE